MIKSRELSNPHSCLSKARPDEPIFVLRAHDPLFAQTIRHWAAMAHDVHSIEKTEEARKIADEGDAWLSGTQTNAAQQAKGAIGGPNIPQPRDRI